MKKVIGLILAVTALTVGSFAQDPAATPLPKNVITVTATVNKADVDIKNVQNESLYSKDDTSAGFNFEYVHFPTKGPIGFGLAVGMAFHNQPLTGTIPCGAGCTITRQGNSVVSRAHVLGEVYVQKRSGTFQPYVKGMFGGDNGNLGGVVATSAGARRINGSKLVYGAGGGMDVCFGEKKSKCLRTGVDVTKGLNDSLSQLNVQFQIGASFKFGR